MLSLKLQDFSAQAGWCKVAAAVLFFVALLFLVQLKSERKQGERGRVTCCEGSQVVFKLWDTVVRTLSKGFYLLLSYLWNEIIDLFLRLFFLVCFGLFIKLVDIRIIGILLMMKPKMKTQPSTGMSQILDTDSCCCLFEQCIKASLNFKALNKAKSDSFHRCLCWNIYVCLQGIETNSQISQKLL